jgi:hypothetical protein
MSAFGDNRTCALDYVGLYISVRRWRYVSYLVVKYNGIACRMYKFSSAKSAEVDITVPVRYCTL